MILYRVRLHRRMTKDGIKVDLETSQIEYTHYTAIGNLSPTKVNKNNLEEIYFIQHQDCNKHNNFSDFELVGYTIENVDKLKLDIINQYAHIEYKHGLTAYTINEYENIDKNIYGYNTYNENTLSVEVLRKRMNNE